MPVQFPALVFGISVGVPVKLVKLLSQAFSGEVVELVPFPLEYALYQMLVSPARCSRARWNPELEVTFQYRQDYLETVLFHLGEVPANEIETQAHVPSGRSWAS